HSSTTAMCAQGSSAGSGAVAYSIVWYGVGSTLNNVELNAGPVFGDIEIGCQAGPSASSVNICANNQTGCSPGTLAEAAQSAWQDNPQYISNYLTSVQSWTGNLRANRPEVSIRSLATTRFGRLKASSQELGTVPSVGRPA
ncbi:MAG TPA: hypothetical protein VND65_02465, partial [Candidatus Binatia bacterium]|nr:hypothetical protein [Candidatus Binatia bacterium]